ncbi:MAG: hypothetical protein JXR34_09410 [Bacteroidales bacterium]|nr:hypothetical protein [Bacteroidales bacterium]
MKVYLFLIVSIFIIYSCEETEVDKSTIEKFIISNNSLQNVTIVPENPIINNYIFDSVSIKNNESYTMVCSEPGGCNFPLASTKSIIIYFNDSIKYVCHFDSLSILPSGNILKLKDWSGGKIDDYHSEYEFNFTEADYLEALKHQ